MCLEAVEYCVWGEQWLPPGSSPPADLSCQVSVLAVLLLPAPKALEAPSLQEAEMGMSPPSLSPQGMGPGHHPTPQPKLQGHRKAGPVTLTCQSGGLEGVIRALAAFWL